MRPERGQLVINLDVASDVRPKVGVMAWAVLEALAARSVVVRHERVATCGSRAVADDLGVSKDSVARGLRVLIEAGLVERMDQRDLRTGRFASTTYRLALSDAGIRPPASVLAARRTRTGGPDLDEQGRGSTEQLTFPPESSLAQVVGTSSIEDVVR